MILYWLILGTAAGFLGTKLLDIKLGIPQTIALGVIGALLGGLVLRVFLSVLGMAAGFIGALLGVLVLILGYKYFIEGRK
ncbi:MAG: GlsB/YeaQ/YmgE family stress response membrane protein [Rhodobacteraceae bacterium]|nr:GlsB/YeaQ/YmgE family stress response membrane protein [Paracoccaceae bacterium]